MQKKKSNQIPSRLTHSVFILNALPVTFGTHEPLRKYLNEQQASYDLMMELMRVMKVM
jgi:hypothetical protein